MKECNFQPDDDQVKIFVCGPTVYDYIHLGHARLLLFYDMMARYLLFRGFRPTAIVNITDIDPIISSRAKTQGVSSRELSSKFIEELYIDMISLGITSNLNFARVSDYIDTARQFIIKLLKRKLAYSLNGNIYLDTGKMTSYGRLSRLTRSELNNMRFDIAPGKYNATDTLLWNTSDDFGERYPDDMLGSGVPSWHMQDSSVAMSNFRGCYDIHGGGIELIYPHHESHLTQLQALASSPDPVKYWTHVGLITVSGKKMSKSLGNAVRIRDLLRKYNSNVLRLYLFSKHYRESFEFSISDLEKFEAINESIANALIGNDETNREFNVRSKTHMRKFMMYMEDDFDTQNALETMITATKSTKSVAALKNMVSIFGLRY
jgi:cysteinyl-tRNA synthetase